jgi:hypothetical protein
MLKANGGDFPSDPEAQPNDWLSRCRLVGMQRTGLAPPMSTAIGRIPDSGYGLRRQPGPTSLWLERVYNRSGSASKRAEPASTPFRGRAAQRSAATAGGPAVGLQSARRPIAAQAGLLGAQACAKSGITPHPAAVIPRCVMIRDIIMSTGRTGWNLEIGPAVCVKVNIK